MNPVAISDPIALNARCAGAVFTPEDDGWDAARQAWNLAVDQRPSVVVYPLDEDDVAAIVTFAGERDLRIAVQATGHNAAALGSLEDTVLVRTWAMRGVEANPHRRVARVRAGDLWEDVVGPVAAHGLAALAGSSPDLGVVGYSLGGGIGWLARRYGLQANSITAVELITADGSFLRTDLHRDPELFWALRGGGGNFGVVTALEFALHPVTEIYGGALAWDWSEAERVLSRWAEWAPTAPDEITTSARILQLPPYPQIPAPIRGRRLVMIDGAHSGNYTAAERVLAPLRELAPELDTFGPTPAPALVRLHGDLEQPTPTASRHAMLGELPGDAVQAFVAAAGPGSGSPLLAAELRQLGGALGRAPEEHGALAKLDASVALFGVGIAATPEMGVAVAAHARVLAETMEPWCTGGTYLNLAEQPTDTRSAYPADVYERLQSIRRQVDPNGIFQANPAIEVDSRPSGGVPR